MVKQSSQPLRLWFLVLDILATAGGWLAAYWIRFNSGWIPIFLDQPAFELCLDMLPVVLIVGLVAYHYAKMYDVHRLTRVREEMYTVAKGVALMTLFVAVITFAMRYQYESRLAFLIFSAQTFICIMFARRLSWLALGRLRSLGYNQSHALIVGTGRLARRTARSLQKSSWTGIQTVAYVEDDPKQYHCDIPVVGPIDALPQLIEELHIEHVYIALPMNRYAAARHVFDSLSQSIVDVRLVVDAPALAALSLTTTHVHGMTFIGLRESSYHGVNVVVKRIMDVILAIIAIILFSPVIAIIALLVKRSSPGPIFYRQERCSLNGHTFSMLKFRTMKEDAECNGPQMTKKKDDRITRIGRFLRATNLDELPQLFNVLRGEMSLVGPRPERPVFVEQFQQTIPNYMARHAVKCGMTGWAQVNGWRGNSSLRRRVQYDLYYITHWNPWFDIRIMLLTIWHMLASKQRHAY